MTAEQPPREWQQQADVWAGEAIAAGEPTAWFERLYAAGRDGTVTMPWDRDDAHPLLADWLAGQDSPATGARAVVIGCGLGADAERLAQLGYGTTAFDLSESAVATAVARNPGSQVDYVVADLLDPPTAWHQAFDLVVEIYTVQAVPVSMREAMTRAVTDLVAPGGTLVAIQAVHEDGDDDGPPFPLTRAQIDAFADGTGLKMVDLEQRTHPANPSVQLWQAHLRRS
ncbi:class I SAM-dependent methyltransferase [Luteipulveratus mongoliensis]|uniref:SAM-dependent methyltransferase n=1 Tax=Luteipulveratus mongoliensis TaxID=571913 RepID=A0A0K1JKC0_9MICO|nr:class I SAM-dependent methyltransferase [Luteipulveratus mongoliensis]AKU17162.1 hypothetical protein VV02_17035 [Luteipulveratus mongoliensis]